MAHRHKSVPKETDLEAEIGTQDYWRGRLV